MYEASRSAARDAEIDVPDFEVFWSDGYVELPLPEQRPRFARLRDGAPSGRIETFSETTDGFGYDACPGHPEWMPPREWQTGYPLRLIAHQPSTRRHSQLDHGSVSREAKIDGIAGARRRPDRPTPRRQICARPEPDPRDNRPRHRHTPKIGVVMSGENGSMARKIDTAAGRAAIDAVRQGSAARADTATAVRYLLQLLEEKAPGKSVEVRVPPFGAVQVIQGPSHTRGTPPNVVETDPATWVALATGELSWADALAAGRIAASGTRADIAALIPVRW